MTDVRSTRLRIGMEIHVELATHSKMFSRSANVAHSDHFEASPNSLVDPVVAGLPGALPVMNKQAVELSMMVGLALNCEIASFSKWDRKNYFYPDLPKGYQISQFDLPLCRDGYLDIPSETAEGGSRRINILRAHLEEDAGKLSHDRPGGGFIEGSLVDLNRAGTPLLEIVTQPDFTTAQECDVFAKELRNICRFLGVTEGIMQRGHMRFEPNINVIIELDDHREIATPIVEIKNLNSFKSLRGAIEHEYKRQVEAWKVDGLEHASGRKSTWGWNDEKCITFLQREKEEAHDYRYFPDPDLVPVVISDDWRLAIQATLPELPRQRRERYESDFGLSPVQSLALTDERDLSVFYESCIDSYMALDDSTATRQHGGQQCANQLLNAGAKRANELNRNIHDLGITPSQVAQIVILRDGDEIGSTAADTLFGLLCDPALDEEAKTIAQQEKLLQVRDEGQLDKWVEQAIEAQPQAAEDFAAGKDAAAGRLVGEIMKRSQGQADAKAVQAKLRQRLRDE
ncbi:MAG: Asp-tRNA(Asn)/Glu-tRNA(Gln) amidotransferase subunit GatB [Planctomycetota bacterium]|nr:Asp-tRNA(Asn)/Glu-tRNA(Gln) amidotransferase subunit GatB [Planctomycetota bacterium]